MNTSESALKVFVYGTLKPGEVNYQRYCQGKVRSQVPGYTWGKLYDLAVGYPAMTEGSSKVQGVLFTFPDSNILSSLDRLEGYQENRGSELNEYYRKLVPVYDHKNRFLDLAWSYFMTLTKVSQFPAIVLDCGCWGNCER